MIFSSSAFGFFLTSVFVLSWLLCSRRSSRVLLLLLASWFFYGCWNAKYLLLIFGSTALDYWVGGRIAALPLDRRRARLWLLRLSLIGNLGCLGVFKYYNFFRDNIESLLGGFGIALPHLDVLLPVGISFYTFQTLSYTIDIYRGQMQPARNLREFALFVSFFPQLVAGPIVRAREFLPQLEREPAIAAEDFRAGLYRIAVGLVKKVLVGARTELGRLRADL
ncbi:MAG: MBOAT family protein, partial [Planctomycetota bacterium]